MNQLNKGITLLLLTAIISGFSIFLNSYGVQGFDSSVFTFAKNVVVAILLFAVILAVGQWKEIKQLTKKQWMKLSAIGLIGGSIPFLMFFKGLQMTAGPTSSFIHKTLFIYASIFALIFLKEKLNKWFVLGAAMILAGTYLMLRPTFEFGTGHLLIIGATIFWAAENTLSKHALKNVSGNTVAFGRMFFGSIFILAFLLATGKVQLITSMTSSQYTWILVTGLLLLGFLITFYNGLKHVSVSTATSILAIGAPITIVLDWAFKGTPITAFTAGGMILLAAGTTLIIWLTNTSSKSKTILVQKHSRRSR